MVDSQLEDLILCKATPQQWRRIQESQVKVWGGGLSVERFIERETQVCLKSPLSQKGENTTWYADMFCNCVCGIKQLNTILKCLIFDRILVPGNDTATLDYACSCETYRRPIFIKDSDHADGAEEPLLSIASVVWLLFPMIESEPGMLIKGPMGF
jgi:hypothetical protein